MRIRNWLVHHLIHGLVVMLNNIDASSVDSIPMEGPLILIGNHVNFLDSPIAFDLLYPRPVKAFVKRETLENPLMGFLFKTWGMISIRRGEADLEAFKQAYAHLEQKGILLIAPEGTRSNTGKLSEGHPGIILLAIKTGVPIIPIGISGIEHYNSNFQKLRRNQVLAARGPMFRLKPGIGIPSRTERIAITTEIMYRIARILPEENRGIYSDIENATTNYLEILEN